MIYEYERKDGLESQLREKNVIATDLKLTEDLFGVEAILVSVGWNGNDDVFLKEDVWNARHTPIDKQFNLMHNEKDIIGHIIASKVISNGVVVPDSTEIANIPNIFDVLVESVIYSKFRDGQLFERAQTLINEIKDGIWKVSMECWHTNFDYALMSAAGEQTIVERNAETAFLTKHLRRYKGKGEYEGYKIGRVLRNFYFSGKGLVKTPANKRSVFTNFSRAEEKVMSVTYTQEQYKALEDKLALAEKSAREVSEKSVAKELTDYKDKMTQLEAKFDGVSAQLTQANDKIKELEGKLSVAEEIGKNKDKQIQSLEATKADLQKKVDENFAALQKIEQDKVKAERLTKLVKVGVASDKAQALVDQSLTVSNEIFDTLVSSFPVSQGDTAFLDDLEGDEAKLAVASIDPEKHKEVRTATASWLKESFTRKKK